MLTLCPKAEPFFLETSIKARLNADYLEKLKLTSSTDPHKTASDHVPSEDQQPLDFSTRRNFKDAPKSPISKDWPKSYSPESGVSSGGFSPERSSPILQPCYPLVSRIPEGIKVPNVDYSDINYKLRESYAHPLPPVNNLLPNAYHKPTKQPYSVNNDLFNHFQRTQNNASAALLALHQRAGLFPTMLNLHANQNLLTVPQDQCNTPCIRNLQEKFHIPPSEMPTVSSPFCGNIFTFGEMKAQSEINYEKFRKEVLRKKKDDNPAKSRRLSARGTPYDEGRTDLRALDEGRQEANGDSQGEVMDPEMHVRKRQYQEKRRKNNEAAKKSRDQRKMKEEETAIRAAFWELENMSMIEDYIQLQCKVFLITKSLGVN